MEAAFEWAFTTISTHPVTATVLLIAAVAGLTAWVIVRDISAREDAEIEASVRRVDAFSAEVRREAARRERDAVAYTGKEQP